MGKKDRRDLVEWRIETNLSKIPSVTHLICDYEQCACVECLIEHPDCVHCDKLIPAEIKLQLELLNS